MAIVVIGGLITSTFLSLLVIPVLFTYVDDAIQKVAGLFRRRRPPAAGRTDGGAGMTLPRRHALALRAACAAPWARAQALRADPGLRHRWTSTGTTRPASARCRCACTCRRHAERDAAAAAAGGVLARHRRLARGLQLPGPPLGQPGLRQPAPAARGQRPQQVWNGNPFGVSAACRTPRRKRGAGRVQDLRFALDQRAGRRALARASTPRASSPPAIPTAPTPRCWRPARGRTRRPRLDLRDPRIKAAIVISAPPFYGESAASGPGGIGDVPTLHVTATEDVIRIPGYYSGPRTGMAVFDATGSARKTLAVFEGGSHSMFTDRAGTGGAVLNPQVKAATQACRWPS
jgi:hypothetical protein